MTSDPNFETAHDRAQENALDGALGAWAKADPLTGAGDEAALLRILQHADQIAMDQPSRSRPWWWMGGAVAMAASAALALLLAPGSIGTGAETGRSAGAGDGPVMLAQADDDDESIAFALLYTPTSEEEYQL